jgi:putative hemolysin
MPQAFENCRKNGGRIRTKSLKDGKYLHICYLNGKSFPGYVKGKNKKTEKTK